MPDVEANKAIVRRYMEAVGAGDAAAADALQARDATWWVLGYGDMTRAVFSAAVGSMIAAATSRSVTIISMIAEGDRVAAEIVSEMHFGDRVYRNQYHDLFVIRGGLIVAGREYLDTKVVDAFQAVMAG
ncbi:nuclear transport factor 2 family protein [Sphingomonas sp. 28-63-12]|uniref:nuclear transport factor 2 family protein n=1 Tax=Sphingomonas sp. 28-63-12 TaxID=1970434 RepID=UPI000BCB397F|nr:MAG: hypothetical protein B7Y47_01195 [Sphingomonas sp. 28-63-12]